MNINNSNVKSNIINLAGILAIGALITFSTSFQASAHQPDKEKSLASFEQKNEKIAREFLNSLGQKDMKKVASLLTDDFTFQNGMNPTIQQGKEAFTQWWYGMINNATLLEPSVVRMTVMGNTVLVENKFHYKDTETEMTFGGTKFIHIKNGKVNEYQEYRLPSAKKKKMKMSK